MNTFQRVSRMMNSLMVPLLNAPVVGGLLGKSMTEITYTGRRSGKTITLPVAYRLTGDDTVTIGVAMPDQKSWWRNFDGDPQPIVIKLDGEERSGTAVAKSGAKGTAVVVTLSTQL